MFFFYVLQNKQFNIKQINKKEKHILDCCEIIQNHFHTTRKKVTLI